MKTEIEYKFLVNRDKLPDLSKFGNAQIVQAYLSYDPTIRVRTNINTNTPFADGKFAFFTVKGKGSFARREFDKKIEVDDAEELMKMAKGVILEKTRYFIPIENEKEVYWEIDVYKNIWIGRRMPLIVAELEIPTEDYKFEKPDWVGEDVTNNRYYSNASLSRCGER